MNQISYPSVDQCIGNTPLIELKTLSELTQCRILGKAEFMNPGGSVKDRAALNIITEAEKKKQLEPGMTIVEGTAGNTGIGLAFLCQQKKYNCVIFMPDNQSPEKLDLLTTLGAEVKLVKAVPFKNPENFQKQAKRYAEERSDTFWSNQFDNEANMRAHYQTTGAEIYNQTQGTIDAFICSTGSGGTLAGISKYLKEKNNNIKTFLADPYGSSLRNFIQTKTLSPTEGSSIIEGIGNSRITNNFNQTKLDDALSVSDVDAIRMMYHLLHKEGLFLGPSSGLNVFGAVEVAKKLGPNHTIVTILCDTGHKYISRLYNSDWLNNNSIFLN